MNDQTFGFGYQQPNSSANEFNVTEFIIRRMLAKVRTVTLVKVVACSTNNQLGPIGTVDVLPLVNQVDGQNNATKHTTVFGLLCFRNQAGSNAIIMDPQVNDVGIAIICDRDISSIKSAGSLTQAQTNPGSNRRFDFADGIYLGGVLGLGGTPKQFIQFTSAGIVISDSNGNSITTGKNGLTIADNNKNQIITSSSGVEVAGGKPFQTDGNITGEGNISAANDILAASGSPAAISLLQLAAQALRIGGGANITGGFTQQPADLGNTTGGTVTPNPSTNLKQVLTNNAVSGLTIAATSQVGDLMLLIVNGPTAGTVTFTGFTKQWASDAMDTINGHRFVVIIYGLPDGSSAYLVKALQ